MMKVGILHPGDMGSSLGGALVSAGHSVFWVKEGRSAATARRAVADQLEAVDSLDELVSAVDVILSICPPHGALELAESVVAAGFGGIYIDANAVAPQTARQIEATVTAVAEFVDGGVIGPPARQAGSTRLYLSGARADEISSMFAGSFVQAQTLEGGPGAASALKMCYAAWTKGSAALLIAVAALARREGVQGALVDEWQLSQPDLPGQLQGALLSSAPKAWRFTGEMREIAATFLDQEMPDGFHLAAAEIYRRLSEIPIEHQRGGETILKLLAPE